jgi:ribose transport system substrate-binding protein
MRAMTVTQRMRRFVGAAAGFALVALALAVAGTSAPAKHHATASPAAKCNASNIRLVDSIRSLSNPYHAVWSSGSKGYVKSLGLPSKNYQLLLNEGDSAKQVAQVRTLLATGNDACTAISVDPNENSVTETIAKLVQKSGAWVTIYWNKNPGLLPWKGYSHWVSFIGFDGRIGGYQIAKELFKAMGNKGNIVAIQGLLDNVPAQQRFAGLKKALAETPGVKMLDQQTANWDRTQALTLTKTFLAKYPGKINGVWAANDNMALGALQALKAAGLAGKVPVVGIDAVPEALQDIHTGDVGYVATVASDAYWQGGAGLSLGYQAMMGKLKPNSLPHSKRAFYAKTILITKQNVGTFIAPAKPAAYKADWANPFKRFVSPITR